MTYTDTAHMYEDLFDTPQSTLTYVQVAGIAGGEWQGAAHKANLINVKVIAPDPAKKGPGKSSTNGGLAQGKSASLPDLLALLTC